jgi:toxin ParE1/3/4
MPYRVAFVTRARRQLNAQTAYLIDRNPVAAQRLLQRVDDARRQLADFPRSGPPAVTPGLRRLILAPYVLTYRIQGSVVEILDFRHERQTPFNPAPR